MRGVLTRSLLLVTLVPFLPLGWLTWHGYRSEVAGVEREIQGSNRHIALLAAASLATLLDRVEVARQIGTGPAALPPAPEGVRWERVGQDGVVLASGVDPARRGRPCEYRSELVSLADGASRVGPWLDGWPPTVLVPSTLADGSRLIAILDPEALHAQLGAWSDTALERHVYVVDRRGGLLFYSDLEVSRRGDDLRSNPPVRLFLGGGTGEVRYESAVSGRERLGSVQRVPGVSWGVVVSADVGAGLIDLRARYRALALSILFALAMAIVILVWASRRVVTPVLDLSRAVREAERPPHVPLAVTAETRRLAEHDDLVRAFEELATEVATVERELVQAEKAALLGQLASGLAHEMGTPLNVIIGNAQYLLRKEREDGAAREMLEQVVRQAQRIAAMIRRLLDFSRPAEARLMPLELRAVIGQTLEMVPRMIRPVEVRVDVDAETPPVLADPKLLEHALLNLVVNACQAMPEGGVLGLVAGPATVSEGTPGGEVCVHVTDTGCGIPPESLQRIFEPFYTTKTRGEGTGLGLAIVERIVRQHGGRVEVSSQVDRGTVFSVRLRAATVEGNRD